MVMREQTSNKTATGFGSRIKNYPSHNPIKKSGWTTILPRVVSFLAVIGIIGGLPGNLAVVEANEQREYIETIRLLESPSDTVRLAGVINLKDIARKGQRASPTYSRYLLCIY